MWSALTARFRVIAIDMIGFGWSAKPRPYSYSILDQADIHERLLTQLGIREIHLFTHDYGDTVAQELLARQADRTKHSQPGLAVASVCLLNGGVFPEAHRPRLIQKLLAGPVGPIVARLSTRRTFSSGLTSVFGPTTPPSNQFLDELWTLQTHNHGVRILPSLLGYMAERRQHRDRWVDVLTRPTIPIRLINGLADPVSGVHLVARYRECVPTPDVIELPRIGHYPHVEDPAAVLAAFFAFHDRR
jgi:pimeloyl-ACP methyl ester carboxylesterase